MLTSFASNLRRSAVRRPGLAPRFSAAAPVGGAGWDHGHGPSDGDLVAVLRAVAGIFAVAGSALGCLLLPSSPSPPESMITFADAELAQNDREQRFAFPSTFQERKPRFLLRDSYRRRVFFNYEKRIRLQSSPEKIFEYFATFRSPDGEAFMLPTDLMRAVIPVFPPSESNIIREGHLRGERLPGELHCAPSTFFMLFDTDNDGLISFPEYIFLVTLLSIPESSFSVAFKMFDVDNNGEIEKEEFQKVMALMRSHNRQGASHRNGLRVGLRVGNSVENGGLLEFFFGKDGKGRLQLDKFVQFLRELNEEIIRLEFAHYDYKSKGTISAKDFALSMVASADINHINKLLDRADEVDLHPNLKDMRITLDEFKGFAELRRKLRPLTVAMFSYGKVNGVVTKQDFQRASSYVCDVSVSDNVVDVIFHVFDANNDGNLSLEEFLRALQRRETDLRQPTVTGVIGLLSCWLNCARNCSFSQMAV